MIPIEIITDLFAGGLLFTTFLMVGKLRLLQMLRYFGIASFFLAGLGFTIALMRGEAHVYLGPLVTLIIKVIFIPTVIYYTAKKIPSSYQLRTYVRPSMTYFLFVLILLISALIVRNLPLGFSENGGFHDLFFFRSLLFISVVLILSGILIIIIRKDLFSQVLGLLTMENGIAAFGLVALHGMPLFLEMGIFFVIILSTIILAVLTTGVHEVYSVGDTEKLNELID